MTFNMPPTVSPHEWKAAREELLVEEKELTHARDALAAKRRRMPRMAVENDYEFEGPNGAASLLDLFEGRRQLIVYRFFFEPGVHGWPEGGCPGCSWIADQITHPAHLNARDTTIALISRAPQPDIERWKARMGWEALPWYTLTDDFDTDFDVGEWHGAGHPVLTGHPIRPLEVDDVGSHGGSDGPQFRVALRRAGWSPGGRPGGALERAPQAGGGPAAAAWRGPGRARARDRPGG